MPPMTRLCLIALLLLPAGCADLAWDWRRNGENLLRAACHGMRNCDVTDGRLVP